MTTQKRALTLDDFWSLKTVSAMRLSPDGRIVAYVVGDYDEAHNHAHTAIWLTSLDGAWTRQFTSGEASDTQPRWSPDGARLAFVSTRHEEKSQIYVIDLTGGEPRRLTNAPHGAHSPIWSPDGTRLCYAASVESDRQKVPQEVTWFEAHPDADGTAPRMRRQTTLFSRFDGRGYINQRIHLFVVEVDDHAREARQLTDGDYDDLDAAWSPDGAALAVVSHRTAHPEHTFAADIWMVEANGGTLTCLTDGTLSASSPAWSPDGRTIAFYAAPEQVAHGYHDTHVWSVSRGGGDQKDVSAQLDQSRRFVHSDYMWADPTPPTWSPDGRTLYFLPVEHGDCPVFALDCEMGETWRVTSPHADIVDVQPTPDGQTLVCLASTPTHPFDIFTVAAAGGNLTAVTLSNAAFLDAVTIVPPEDIRFHGPDGWEIESWLYRPPNAESMRPYPLILVVHGGPQAAWPHAFHFQAQVLAGAGYATLYINPRGSLGYGEAFTRAADWGEKDFLDLMAGVDAVLARGEVDPRRLGVTGLSYGGFMTNWVLGHSDRFAAGVAVNSVANMVSMYGVSDMTALWFEKEFRGPFWISEEQWRRYRDQSPITFVDRIVAPLLLIQAENDYRCPIEEGEQMFTALRMRRRIVELIRVPGASHVIAATAAPLHRYFEWRLGKDWFDTYVKGVEDASQSRVKEAGVITAPTPLA